MYTKKTVIINETGLHARPASQLVQFAKKFPEEIYIVGNDKKINLKHILELLTAGLKKSTEIEVQVIGENEESVCNEIVDFIQNLSE